MDVTLLGTGSPMAPERCATGMLVTAPGCEPLLIDTCGGFELPRQLARIGQPINQLRNVVVTHRHMDHAGGMPALFIAAIPLNIYALPDTQAGIRALMDACFPEWTIHPEVERIEIEPGDARMIGGFAVEFFATDHRVPTVAVRVQHGGRTLAFSADGVPNDGMIACARDADLFICDALCAARDGADWATRARSLMHPVAREAAEMAVAANARSLALTHLARYANADNLLAEAREVFSGPVVVPDDGMRLSV
ncbi:MAG: ribonuclease Z [Chloroflexota bacterium]|nr:ribonuclease Z [Chloroflexota bacterium]